MQGYFTISGDDTVHNFEVFTMRYFPVLEHTLLQDEFVAERNNHDIDDEKRILIGLLDKPCKYSFTKHFYSFSRTSSLKANLESLFCILASN